MPRELVDDTVTVSKQKEASQLYKKGNYGYLLSGGRLELNLAEALYLVESDPSRFLIKARRRPRLSLHQSL